MAKSSIASLHILDDGLILTPERYETRKNQNIIEGIPLYTLCSIKKDTVTPKKADNKASYLILDTGDVKNGFIQYKNFVKAGTLKSAKKIIKPGDVIISRLRSYLRQVAYVDNTLLDFLPKDTILLCSTEFYVLRDEEEISYLAPFLLTKASQNILASAQEGGHHPRFTQKTLEFLKVDKNFFSLKEKISEEFQQSISLLREGEQRLVKQLKYLNNC